VYRIIGMQREAVKGLAGKPARVRGILHQRRNWAEIDIGVAEILAP
jgi:hypothetical protein